MGDGGESPEIGKIVYRKIATEAKTAQKGSSSQTRALPTFGGLGEEKKPEKKASFATKAVLATAAAGAMVGGAKLIDNATSAEAAGNGAHVTIVSKDNQQNGTVTGNDFSQNTSERNKNAEALTAQGFFDKVFKTLTPEQRALALEKVNTFKAEAESNNDMVKAYKDIIVQYGPLVKEVSQKYGIAEEWFYGIIFVESKGDTLAYNESSGSAGLVQFLAPSGEDMGLKVYPEYNEADERFDPEKCLNASARFLKTNEEILGGIEEAVWSNNAGAGNVMKAWEEYFKHVAGEDMGDYGQAIGSNNSDAVKEVLRNFRRLMDKYHPNATQFLSDSEVQKFVGGLKEDTGNYFYRVIGAVMALREQEAKVADLGGGLKVTVADTPQGIARRE